MEKGKKGAFSIEWTIVIIVLVLGFTVLLIFLFNLFDERVLDEDVCHESVVIRGTLPNPTSQYLSLKCKTKKICITADSNYKCSDLSGETGIMTARVSSLDDVQKVFADETLACWNMMGQGKLSLFYSGAERYGIGQIYPSCIICSRIAINESSLKENGIKLEEMDLYKYMLTHKAPNREISYYKAIAGERGLFTFNKEFSLTNNERGQIIDKPESETSEVLTSTSNNPGTSPSKETAILFMQISSPNNARVIENTLTDLGLVYGITLWAAPKLVLGASRTLFTSAYFWAAAFVAGLYQQGSVFYNRALSVSYCGDVSGGKEARKGCSVIRTIDYSEESITKYCQNIESI